MIPNRIFCLICVLFLVQAARSVVTGGGKSYTGSYGVAREVRPDQYQCFKTSDSSQNLSLDVALDSVENFLQVVVSQKNGKLTQVEGLLSDHSALMKLKMEQDLTLNAWSYMAATEKMMAAYKSSEAGFGFKGGGNFSFFVGGFGGAGMRYGSVWGVPAVEASAPTAKNSISERPGDIASAKSRAGDLAAAVPTAGQRAVAAGTNGSNVPKLKFNELPKVAPSTGSIIKSRDANDFEQKPETAQPNGWQPGARAGDKVGPRAGASIGTKGIIAFSAKFDGNGNLTQLVYRDGNELPRMIKADQQGQANSDPIFQKVKAKLDKLNRYAACCADDSKASCDVKYVPPLLVAPVDRGPDDMNRGGTIMNPFGGASGAR